MLTLAILMQVACTEAESKHNTQPQKNLHPLKAINTQQVTSQNGHYVIHWRTSPTPLSSNSYFSLILEVNESMKPINYKVDVSVDAGMKQHNHGMHTRPIIKRLANNRFMAKGMLFHMSGDWQIDVVITRGILKDTATIGINL